MNGSRFSCPIASIVSVLVILACLSTCFTLAPAKGQAITSGSFDKKVQLSTQLLKGYLSNPKSKLGNFYKINIVTADPDGKNPVKYEDLFSCSKIGDQPGLIGCRRYASIDLSKKHVAMEINFSQKEPAEEEVIAASFAVAPTLVELLLNDNFAGTVSVPAASYDQFMRALNSQGWQPASQTTGANTQLIPIHLQSDPLARADVLLYQPSLKK